MYDIVLKKKPLCDLEGMMQMREIKTAVLAIYTRLFVFEHCWSVPDICKSGEGWGSL